MDTGIGQAMMVYPLVLKVVKVTCANTVWLYLILVTAWLSTTTIPPFTRAMWTKHNKDLYFCEGV